MNPILENEGDFWSKVCSSCCSSRDILRKLIFVAVNCFLANTVKNYNSQLIAKGIEKRKFKIFKNYVGYYSSNIILKNLVRFHAL